ncbi:predicted protein [Uncinocarpus reesii 1704]|uniref:Uncharacterized protein n=1 Tax=Uncinocarpus reesii (strain UAMH 1704) TaxID=336963 RepID=C4JZY0_UNCRE|nr:uncharacterized protein UREG_07731 [Uncinocarpus reesii 1704]EEP82866.1 predicted protein [Uncinocarpus reesii 1704]
MVSQVPHDILNQTFPNFVNFMDDEINFSVANPDAVIYSIISDPTPVLGVEVAFNESGIDLEQRAKDLLFKTPLKAVLLVNIKEKTEYENPFRRQKNVDLYRARLQQDGPTNEPKCDESDADEPEGAVYCYGIRWVDALTGAVQIWTRDPETGDPIPRTKKTYFYGRPELILEQWEKTQAEKEKQGLKSSPKGRGKRTPKKIEGKAREDNEEQEEEESGPVIERYPELNLTMADLIGTENLRDQKALTLRWDEVRRLLRVGCILTARQRLRRAVKHLPENKKA